MVEGRLSDRETASAPAWPVRAAPYLVRSSDFTPSHFLYLKWICSGSRCGGMPVYHISPPSLIPGTDILQSAPRSSFPLNQSISLRLSSASAVSLTDSINEDCCLNKALHLTKALLVLLLNILNKGTRNLEGLWGLEINMDSLHILLAMRC